MENLICRGAYDETDISFLKVKCDEEVRLLLGCTKVETNEGLLEGRVGPNPLSY